MVGLGDLPGGAFESWAYGISSDGSIVVGQGCTLGDPGDCFRLEAFIWDAQDGMRLLQDVLTNDYGLDMTGWRLTSANAVSADDRAIVGVGRNPNHQTEAFLARIPEPATLNLLLAPTLLRRRLTEPRASASGRPGLHPPMPLPPAPAPSISWFSYLALRFSPFSIAS